MEREIIDYDMYGDPIYADEPTESKTFDAFGNELENGDTIQLIKELPVKGTKITLKK